MAQLKECPAQIRAGFTDAPRWRKKKLPAIFFTECIVLKALCAQWRPLEALLTGSSTCCYQCTPVLYLRLFLLQYRWVRRLQTPFAQAGNRPAIRFL